MALASSVQTSFLGGEWSASAQGDFVSPKYKISMGFSLNGFPIDTGAWARRSGTAFAGTTRQGAVARAITYAFEDAQPYTMEFSATHLRFWNGPSIATTNDSVAVSAISGATPAVMTLATAVTWVTGDTVFFSGLGTADAQLMDRRFIVTKTDTTHFSLADEVTGASLAGSLLQTFSTGTVNHVQEVVTPYIGTDWLTLRSIQAEVSAVFVHNLYTPQILVATPNAGKFASFALSSLTFLDGPYLDPFINGVQANPSATTGIIQITLSFQTWNPTTAYQTGAFVTSGGVNYESLVDQNIGNPETCTFTSSSSNVTCVGNAFTNNQAIVFELVTPGTSVLPTISGGSLVAGTVYFVKAQGSPFTISATPGGTAIAFTSAGTAPITVSLAPASNSSVWKPVSPNAAINQGRGFLSTDVGRLVRLFSEPPLWSSIQAYVATNVVSYNPTNAPGAATYWQSLTSNTNKVPGSDITNWQLVAPGAALPAIVNVAATAAASSGPAQWSWGKILSLVNAVPGDPSGIAHIGSLTSGGGLAAAFDGVISKPSASSAISASTTVPLSTPTYFYVGQNYSGASPSSYAVQSVTITPSSDKGFVDFTSFTLIDNIDVTAYLYGSNSPPSSATNGTLLGSTNILQSLSMLTPAIVGTAPITILSTDSVTTYAYVWVAIAVTQNVTPVGMIVVTSVSQLQVVAAAGTSTSSSGINVEILGPPLLYTSPIITWQLGAYSNTTGWPSCGSYVNGRLWLSGAIGNRFDASYANGLTGTTINFAPTNQYGTVTAAHAISEVIDAADVNPIFWIEPDKQGMIMGTQAGEWLIFAPSPGGLSPINIDSQRVTKIRCANIEPRRAEHTMVVVQAHQRKLVEYFSDVFSGKFTAPDLSEKWKALTYTGIAEIAYQQELLPIVWMRLTNGNLIGATYKRDTLMTSQGPTYCGAHHHTLGSGRSVVSIAAGPSQTGAVDALTMITLDSVTGIYHFEILTDLFEEVTPLLSAWFLDDAISTVTYTLSGTVVTITGLWHLNGKTVTAWCGGVDAGDFAVTNGIMTVPLFGQTGQANPLFTSAFVTAFAGAMPIVVGFTYSSQGKGLRPQEPAASGARNGPGFGKKMRFHGYQAQLVTTQGISFGTSLDPTVANRTRLAQLKTRGGGSLLATNVLFSGLHKDTISDDPMGYDNAMAWQVTRPYPAMMTALGVFVETSDE